ncbi:hypothetical protein AC249_AIPGENE17176 [Exaiptasia diaphana]|nr:hypothetical protein AC249_AIPGENE17176 [Exaiptasia diaphana]
MRTGNGLRHHKAICSTMAVKTLLATVLIIASTCPLTSAEDETISKRLLSNIFKYDSSTSNSSTVNAKILGMDVAPPDTWSPDAKLFFFTVKKFGLFKLKNLHLIKINNSMVKTLELNNRSITMRNGQTTKKKRQFHEFCLERVVKTIVLAHASEQLAYSIDEIECHGKCHSNFLKVSLGECILRKKTMIVYIQNSKGAFKAQTVQTGCACECLHFARFQ